MEQQKSIPVRLEPNHPALPILVALMVRTAGGKYENEGQRLRHQSIKFFFPSCRITINDGIVAGRDDREGTDVIDFEGL